MMETSGACFACRRQPWQKEKMLQHDDQWHFSHGLEIPQSVPCCPCFTDREIRSLCLAWNFLVWVYLSLGTVTLAHWYTVKWFKLFLFSNLKQTLDRILYIWVCFTMISSIYSHWMTGIQRTSVYWLSVSHHVKLWCLVAPGCTGLYCLCSLLAKTKLTTCVMCVLSGCSKQSIRCKAQKSKNKKEVV